MREAAEEFERIDRVMEDSAQRIGRTARSALVADEVRKLVERTSGATGEIVALVTTMQEGIRGTREQMGAACAQVARWPKPPTRRRRSAWRRTICASSRQLSSMVARFSL